MTSLETIPGIEIRNINEVDVTWLGEHRFEAGRRGGPTHRIDSGGKEGPGPVETLLGALAACTAIDVVDILEKRRTPAASLSVAVKAARAKATPPRVIGVLLSYRIAGAGIERVHAERAIELSVTKYCSVRDSLDPNLPVRWELELESEETDTPTASPGGGAAG